MPAYVICHVERHDTGRAAVTRAFLTRRIAELWNGTFRFDATWIVQADKTSDQIRDELTPCLGDGDALLVIGAGGDAAWAGFEPAECDWLVEHM